MNSRLKSLADAIHIHNEYFRVAGPILEHIKEVSKQFIGKKIETQQGLSKKFYEATKVDRDTIEVKPLPGTKWAKVHGIYVHVSYKSLIVEIKLCFSDGTTGCTYEERSWYYGKTDENGVLLEVDDDYKVPTTVLDYETELNAILEFRKAERLATQAEEKINIGREAYKYIDIEHITGEKD